VDVKVVWSRSLGWNIEIMRVRREGVDYTIIEDGADCYPWTETFVIWPRRSVTGAPLFWTRAYKRRVWIMWGTGFHMEPEIQYATAFDLLVYNPKVLGNVQGI
jgi:hypothetical protein